MGMTDMDNGFSAADFHLLEEMARPGAPGEPDRNARVEALWAKATRLVTQLGDRLFVDDRFTADVWPDTAEDERLPFIWARLKRAENARFATHIGLFLSPDQCNLCIDLEKDLLDAGAAGERLEQVLEFYRGQLAERTASLNRSDVRVWTDADNVVSAVEFPSVDFGRFMEANTDTDHPWPRVGYLFDAAEVQAFADRWVEEMTLRAGELAPVYDAMTRAYRREP